MTIEPFKAILMGMLALSSLAEVTRFIDPTGRVRSRWIYLLSAFTYLIWIMGVGFWL